jgi:quercetin 2,3-dioxygenase
VTNLIIRDALPRTPTPYVVPDGGGERYLLGDQLAAVKVYGSACRDHCAVVVLAGNRGAGLAAHVHPDAGETLFVLDGRVQVWFGDQSRQLAAGDHLSVPAGVAHAHRFLSETGRLILSWSPGGPERFFELAGTPTDAWWPPAPSLVQRPDEGAIDAAAGAVGMRFLEHANPTEPVFDAPDDVLPASVEAYVLRDREGERTGGRRQLVTALQKIRNSDGRAYVGVAAYGDFRFFPRHYHRTHTEVFLILDGRASFFVDGDIVAATRGDLVLVPPGTQHCFEFRSALGRFWSICAPGHFEPFFDWTFEPTDSYVPLPGGQSMRPEILERVDRELDHVTAGPPPPSPQMRLDDHVYTVTD